MEVSISGSSKGSGGGLRISSSNPQEAQSVGSGFPAFFARERRHMVAKPLRNKKISRKEPKISNLRYNIYEK
jgi:hypothetical protein